MGTLSAMLDRLSGEALAHHRAGTQPPMFDFSRVLAACAQSARDMEAQQVPVGAILPPNVISLANARRAREARHA